MMSFAAPRTTVFKLWTDPAYVAEWWGIEGSTNPVCELDVPARRPLADRHAHPERTGLPQPGCLSRGGRGYGRLVYTDVPDPTLPEWNGAPPAPGVHTVAFADQGGDTFVRGWRFAWARRAGPRPLGG